MLVLYSSVPVSSSLLVFSFTCSVEDAHDEETCDRNLEGFLRTIGHTRSLPPSSVSEKKAFVEIDDGMLRFEHNVNPRSMGSVAFLSRLLRHEAPILGRMRSSHPRIYGRCLWSLPMSHFSSQLAAVGSHFRHSF